MSAEVGKVFNLSLPEVEEAEDIEEDEEDDEPEESRCQDCWCLESQCCADYCGCSCDKCYCHCMECGHQTTKECKEGGCNCGTCECQAPTLDIEGTSPDPEALSILQRHASGYGYWDYSDSLGDRDILTTIANLYMLVHFEHALSPWPFSSITRMVTGERERIAFELRTNLTNYLIMSTVGEARHAPFRATGQLKRLSPLAQALALSNPDEAFNREQLWWAALKLADEYDSRTVILAARELFRDLEWDESFGGKNWATVCDFALEHTCASDALLWVDHIVDLVHNGGWALDKYYRQEVHIPDGSSFSGFRQVTLKDVLDQKMMDASVLITMLRPEFINPVILRADRFLKDEANRPAPTLVTAGVGTPDPIVLAPNGRRIRGGD